MALADFELLCDSTVRSRVFELCRVITEAPTPHLGQDCNMSQKCHARRCSLKIECVSLNLALIAQNALECSPTCKIALNVLWKRDVRSTIQTTCISDIVYQTETAA